MISYLQIENYKSIHKLGISLNNLNLYFGNNSVGKSTIIQSLLLLRQSYYNNENATKLILNGNLTSVGRFGDVIYENANDNYIRFYIKDSNGVVIDRKYTANNDQYTANNENNFLIEKNVSLLSDNFVYLNAQHISPNVDYDVKGYTDNIVNKYGNNGQFVFPYIVQMSNEHFSPIFANNDNIDTDLYSLLNYWLSMVSKHISIKCIMMNDIGRAQIQFFYTKENGLKTNAKSPINVGYGLTHILSVIFSLITSDKNSLIIIENPESHLHPKAQTAIGKLIGLAANNGAQVICETHSEHIVNAIRVSIKDRLIDNNKCNIMYFSKNQDFETTYVNLPIDKSGNFNDYPEGFLDEWDNALVKLV